MKPKEKDHERPDEAPAAPTPAAKAIPDIPEAPREIPLPGTEDAPTTARRET